MPRNGAESGRVRYKIVCNVGKTEVKAKRSYRVCDGSFFCAYFIIYYLTIA